MEDAPSNRDFKVERVPTYLSFPILNNKIWALLFALNQYGMCIAEKNYIDSLVDYHSPFCLVDREVFLFISKDIFLIYRVRHTGKLQHVITPDL